MDIKDGRVVAAPLRGPRGEPLARGRAVPERTLSSAVHAAATTASRSATSCPSPQASAPGSTERELNDDENLAAMCADCNLGLGEAPPLLWITVPLLLLRLRPNRP